MNHTHDLHLVPLPTCPHGGRSLLIYESAYQPLPDKCVFYFYLTEKEIVLSIKLVDIDLDYAYLFYLL